MQAHVHGRVAGGCARALEGWRAEERVKNNSEQAVPAASPK